MEAVWRLAVCWCVSSSNIYDCAMMAFFVTATCLPMEREEGREMVGETERGQRERSRRRHFATNTSAHHVQGFPISVLGPDFSVCSMFGAVGRFGVGVGCFRVLRFARSALRTARTFSWEMVDGDEDSQEEEVGARRIPFVNCTASHDVTL